MSKIKVYYGPNELEISSGTAKNVADLRSQVEEVLNIPAGATVKITEEDDNGNIKETTVDKSAEKETKIPETAKEVSFTKETGSKA